MPSLRQPWGWLTCISPAPSIGHCVCFQNSHTNGPSVPRILSVSPYHWLYLYVLLPLPAISLYFSFPSTPTCCSLFCGFRLCCQFLRKTCDPERLCSLSTSPFYHLHYSVILQLFCDCTDSIHFSPLDGWWTSWGLDYTYLLFKFILCSKCLMWYLAYGKCSMCVCWLVVSISKWINIYCVIWFLHALSISVAEFK